MAQMSSASRLSRQRRQTSPGAGSREGRRAVSECCYALGRDLTGLRERCRRSDLMLLDPGADDRILLTVVGPRTPKCLDSP